MMLLVLKVEQNHPRQACRCVRARTVPAPGCKGLTTLDAAIAVHSFQFWNEERSGWRTDRKAVYMAPMWAAPEANM